MDPDSDEEEDWADFALIESLFFNEAVLLMEDDDSSTETVGETALLQSFGASDDAAVHAMPPEGSSSILNRNQPPDLHRVGAPLGPSAAAAPPTSTTATATTTSYMADGMNLPLGQAVPPPVTTEPWPQPASAAPAAAASGAEEDRRSKIVSEFTNLASRLGISLPTEILQAMMAVNASSATEQGEPLAPAAAATAPSVTNAATRALEEPSPTLMEMEETAKAAIAATEARKRPNPTNTTATGDVDMTNTSASNSDNPAKRRRRPRILECQEKLAKLQTENDVLKAHLSTVSTQTRQSDVERRRHLESMRRIVHEGGGSLEECHQLITEFSESYADYGRRRIRELSFHLDQVRRLATPAQATKFGLWTVTQETGDANSGSRNPLVKILQNELGITKQQDQKMFDAREKHRAILSNLTECLSLIIKLKATCEEKHKLFHERMERCRRVLSPRQAIKLLVWIEENSAILVNICHHWATALHERGP